MTQNQLLRHVVGVERGAAGWSPLRALIIGTLAVGILDGLDAVIFFGLRSGVTPARIFRGIAVGLLGRDALSGGPTIVALGVLLHFVVAFGIVLVYLVASRRIAMLRRAPILWGPIYGVVAYFVMNKVVIPLSAIGGNGALPAWPVLINGLVIHMFGVGLPAALAARAARAPRD